MAYAISTANVVSPIGSAMRRVLFMVPPSLLGAKSKNYATGGAAPVRPEPQAGAIWSLGARRCAS